MIPDLNYAVIVAGGMGIRMGAALPKQFLALAGRPLLTYSIEAFLRFDPHIRIIVVLPQSHLSFEKEIADLFPRSKHQIQAVAGGETRFHSVQKGLRAVTGSGIIFVHDGVRPFISQDILSRCCEQAAESGSAIPVISVSDSILQWNGSRYARIDRSQLRAAQTPQTFRSALLLRAYEQPFQEMFTDEASVVEATGSDICLVEGARANIKITTPEDLAWAEFYLKSKGSEK